MHWNIEIKKCPCTPYQIRFFKIYSKMARNIMCTIATKVKKRLPERPKNCKKCKPICTDTTTVKRQGACARLEGIFGKSKSNLPKPCRYKTDFIFLLYWQQQCFIGQLQGQNSYILSVMQISLKC